MFKRERGHTYIYKKMWHTYWTLEDLGHPLLLLHHVEVLPQVRRHVPRAEVLRVILIHAIKVALLGVVAGQGQGHGPRRLPHLHQTHVPVESAPHTHSLCHWNLHRWRKSSSLAHDQAVKATSVR